MKRVIRTKKPTLTQLSNMASNLGNIWNRYSTVELKYSGYINGEVFFVFWVCIDDIDSGVYETWEGLQDDYFRFMKMGGFNA